MDQEKLKVYKTVSREFSVKMAIDSDKPITQTAKDLGINPNTLYTWIKKYDQAKMADKTVQTDGLLYKELRRLKKENTNLIAERDMLRKAAACFAGVLSI